MNSSVLPGNIFIDVLSDITLIVGVTAVDVFFIETWKGEASVYFDVSPRGGFSAWARGSSVKKLNE